MVKQVEGSIQRDDKLAVGSEIGYGSKMHVNGALTGLVDAPPIRNSFWLNCGSFQFLSFWNSLLRTIVVGNCFVKV